MSIVFHNSDFIKEDDLVIKNSNRALNYGDGFFETIKIINANPFNFPAHYLRYCFACSVLKLDCTENEESLLLLLNKLIKHNNIIKGSAKIHISRGGEGKYLPNSTSSDIVISTNDGLGFELNTPISLCVFSDEQKTKGKISNIKSINAVVSVLGAMHAKENGFDNAILMNTEGDCIEATNSNIFLVKNKIIYTPPITDGCVNGVMRGWVLKQEDLIEKSLNIVDLKNADEVFITNSISGITAVDRVGDTAFSNFDYSAKLQQKLINLSLGL
jgi:branched-chain amino acid aminotransferase